METFEILHALLEAKAQAQIRHLEEMYTPGQESLTTTKDAIATIDRTIEALERQIVFNAEN